MSNSTDPAPLPAGGPSTGAIAAVIVTLAALAALVWGIAPGRVNLKPAPLKTLSSDCPKVVQDFVPSNVTEIPVLQLDQLVPEQRNRALYRLNFESCRCGCNGSIAYCLVNHPPCETCRKPADQIVATARAGEGAKK